MSKVFRLYKEGTSTYTGWNETPSFPYNSANRDTIDDPDGASFLGNDSSYQVHAGRKLEIYRI